MSGMVPVVQLRTRAAPRVTRAGSALIIAGWGSRLAALAPPQQPVVPVVIPLIWAFG
ncbi:MAG: hypothetical protein KatS3mg059_0961 [Thermomicrobiales bacterium]|nr:MAG: hypothetical protein KatS3mg059_0961 [Thermomicrobiales bacterium]